VRPPQPPSCTQNSKPCVHFHAVFGGSQRAVRRRVMHLALTSPHSFALNEMKKTHRLDVIFQFHSVIDASEGSTEEWGARCRRQKQFVDVMFDLITIAQLSMTLPHNDCACVAAHYRHGMTSVRLFSVLQNIKPPASISRAIVVRH
jgi:hypothetical protein